MQIKYKNGIRYMMKEGMFRKLATYKVTGRYDHGLGPETISVWITVTTPLGRCFLNWSLCSRLPSPYNKQSAVGGAGGGPGAGTTSIPLPATVAATRRCPPDKVRPAPTPTHQSQLGKFPCFKRKLRKVSIGCTCNSLDAFNFPTMSVDRDCWALRLL